MAYLATVKLVALTALRDRLFAAVFLALIAVASVSALFGSTALVEKLEMTVTFAAGAARIALILGLVVFVAFHTQRLYETKELEAILSRAISRTGFVLSYWLGFSALSFVFVLAAGLVLWLLVPSPQGALLWTASLLLEALILVAVSVFAGLMLERATSTVFFTLGFYILARLIGFFVGIRLGSPGVGGTMIFERAIDIIFLFVPRIDLLGQTQWLVYGPEESALMMPVIQCLVFLALVLSAAVFDLRRREF